MTKCTSVDEYEALLDEGVELVVNSTNQVVRQIHAARAVKRYFDNEEEIIDFSKNDNFSGAEFMSIYKTEYDMLVLNILYNKLLEVIEMLPLSEDKTSFIIEKDYVADINVLHAMLWLFENNCMFNRFESLFYSQFGDRLVYMKKSKNWNIRKLYYETYYKEHGDVDVECFNDDDAGIVEWNHIWSNFKYFDENYYDCIYGKSKNKSIYEYCVILKDVSKLITYFVTFESENFSNKKWNTVVREIFNKYNNFSYDKLTHDNMIKLSNFIIDFTDLSNVAMRAKNNYPKSYIAPDIVFLAAVCISEHSTQSIQNKLKRNVYKIVRDMFNCKCKTISIKDIPTKKLYKLCKR